MNRAEKYCKRRIAWLWAPLVGIGGAIYTYSLGLTLTANGLSIIGLGIMLTGAVAALNETRTPWTS